MRNSIIIIGMVIVTAAFASEELQPGETTPIGEVGSVTYLASPHEPDPAGTSFEIKTEAGNVYETVAELTVPAADTYYAGVSPDGKYYFVAGDTGFDVSEYDPVHFLYIYDADTAERVLDGTGEIIDGDVYEFAWQGFAWSNGKLYTIAVIPNITDLYEADPATGNVERIMVEHPIKLATDDGYAYYTEKAPSNSAAYEEFRGTPGPYELEPVGCICCGGSGYDIYYRLDLATRETEKAFDVSATSTIVEPGKPADYLGPEKAVDGDVSTAWVEGADGPGVGETLTIDFGTELNVYNIGIFPGFGKDPRVYYGNNRVKKVRLEFSDGTKVIESFDDEVGMRLIDCYDNSTDSGIEAEWLKVTILDVHEGLEWDDTAISEVAINPY
jgi:hypothetical protein